MLFNSIDFLIFLPIVCLVYFIFPKKYRYLWLLVASYYFYMCWNAKYAILIAASTVITYLCSLRVNYLTKLQIDFPSDNPDSAVSQYFQRRARKITLHKKLAIAVSLIANLGILFLFKYYGFFADTITSLMSTIGVTVKFPVFDYLLPVGISFYTFQALGYTIDVYRGDIDAEKNFFRYALFVSFFPQLVAGPIERSTNLLNQIRNDHTHRFDFERVLNGLLLVGGGMFLKVVVADRAAILVNTVYNDLINYSGVSLIIATIAFAFQIYCDFASYSIIAKGSAQILGYNLMDNFAQPYLATSIGDFWHRWHISLSQWFRDYLYIPLGGSRKGLARTLLNLMIVFILSGLWHGSAWTFVVWGMLHGLYQVIGRLTKKPRQKLYSALHVKTEAFSWKLGQMLFTFALVCFAWIFFRANTFADAIYVVTHMFEPNYWVLTDNVSLYQMGLDRSDFQLLVVTIAAVIAIDIAKYNKVSIRPWIARQNVFFRYFVYVALIMSIVVWGAYGLGFTAEQFIYFQF
ncbi:MAG: MBOAT family O-acyltransferase [Christensenellales bacterium]